MKIQIKTQRAFALALGALALLGGSLAATPARAQDAGASATAQPIQADLAEPGERPGTGRPANTVQQRGH